MSERNPLKGDLELILEHTREHWNEMRGERLFVTGGTGFFGRWLAESFCWINRRLSLGASAVILTRDPEAFERKAPHLCNDPSLSMHRGDVRDFSFPGGSFSHVIHAATQADATLNRENPSLMLDTIIRGTSRTLDFAGESGARKLLLTSSGAVYGPQPPDMTHLPETLLQGPDTTDPDTAYGEGKRVAEVLCSAKYRISGLETKIARCFAFVGPGLPLDTHFAIGNFIGDCLHSRQIVVKGDGTSHRSYMYAADLMIWLWSILFRGQPCRPYNVGGQRSLEIAEIAEIVRSVLGNPRPVLISQKRVPGTPTQRYVPDTTRASAELGLNENVSFEDGIHRTAAWHSSMAPIPDGCCRTIAV